MNQSLTVPEYGKTGVALGSILPINKDKELISVSEYSPFPGREDIVIDKDNPLYCDGDLLLYSLKDKIKKEDSLNLFVTIRGLHENKLTEYNPAILHWFAQNVDDDSNRQIIIKSKVLKVIPHADGTLGVIFNLDINELSKGNYTLGVKHRDQTGILHSSSIPVKI